ncbi:MAG: hypothetical protein AB7V00_02110 [Bacilli bacterium]
MKKLNYFIIFFVISLIAIGLIAMFSTQKRVFRLTTLPKAYSLVSSIDQSEDFSIGIYIDQHQIPFDASQNYSQSFIADSKNENQLPLVLISALPISESIIIDKTTFYLFEFLFRIDFNTNSNYNLEIDNAYLHISRGAEKEEIIILIGSLSFSKVSSFCCDNIVITKLKGNVNDVNFGKNVVGFEMGIRNNSSNDVKIINIKPLLCDVNVSNSDVIKHFSLNFQPSDTINSILGYEYDVASEGTSQSLNLQLELIENDRFYFPLKYQNEYKISQFGLEITYIMNENQFVTFIDNFTFFSDYLLSNNEIHQLTINTYDNN